MWIPIWIEKGNNKDQYPRDNWSWSTTQHGWYKLSFGGSPRGDPRNSRNGCIIRDWNGKIIKSLSKPLHIGTSNNSKLKSLIDGLNICKDLRIKKLVIKGDSTISINEIRMQSTMNWKLKALLEKAMQIMTSFQNYTTNHI